MLLLTPFLIPLDERERIRRLFTETALGYQQNSIQLVPKEVEGKRKSSYKRPLQKLKSLTGLYMNALKYTSIWDYFEVYCTLFHHEINIFKNCLNKLIAAIYSSLLL